MFSIPESQFILTQGVPYLYRSPPGTVPALFRHSHGPPLPLRAAQVAPCLSLTLPRNAGDLFQMGKVFSRGRYSQVKGGKFTLFHLRHLKIPPCLGIWLHCSIFLKWPWQQRKVKRSSGGCIHILNLASKSGSM